MDFDSTLTRCVHGALVPDISIRNSYAQHGVAQWYARCGADYRNPHEAGVREAITAFIERLPDGRVLDLACGSGEATIALRDGGLDAARIDGCDPYTAAAYRERTGAVAYPWCFEDLAYGLPTPYDTVVCSFALHLCPQSWLPSVVQSLAASARVLLILTPHKRPTLKPQWGFILEEERYFTAHRVRARFYRSDRLSAEPR